MNRPRTIYERQSLRPIEGYVPGEQPQSPDIIKLNTNENPYPPAPELNEVLARFEIASLRRYPPPTASPFREAAAELHGVTPASIIATNGGDELLRLAFSTFLEAGEVVGIADPSYSLYPVLAELHGAKVASFQLGADWSLPAHFAAALNEAGAKLALVVNPHAPSGRLTEVADLAALAEAFHGVLLIDEAYVDFVDPDHPYDALPLTERFDNVLILRSLSKGYSLAGLRFGYGIASPSLIEPMQTKTKDSYNTDLLGQSLAVAALRAQAHARRTWASVRRERARLAVELSAVGFACEPSHANFVLATLDAKRSRACGLGAQDVYEQLKARAILVRYFSDPRLADKLRITVGTPEENDALLHALREILNSGAAP